MPLVELVVHQVIPVTIHYTGLHLHLRKTVILLHSHLYISYTNFCTQWFLYFFFFFSLKLTSYLIVCTKFSIFTWTFWLQDFWRTICFTKNTFRKVTTLKPAHPTMDLLRKSEEELGLAGQRPSQTAAVWTECRLRQTVRFKWHRWQFCQPLQFDELLTSTQTKQKLHTTAPNSFSKLILSCSNIVDWPCLNNKYNCSETWH